VKSDDVDDVSLVRRNSFILIRWICFWRKSTAVLFQ